VLEQAMDRGEIRRMAPDRLALFISEGISAIVIRRVMEEAPPPEQDDVDFLAGVILEGIEKQ
jgi:hypothetical protein